MGGNHTSWLNQTEISFGILIRKVVWRGIFKSRQELVDRLMSFIKAYNQEAQPFECTYTGSPLAAWLSQRNFITQHYTQRLK